MSTEKNKVLLVDDDQMLRELLAGLLSDNGYEVEEAANGLEALDQVESRHYDHVITDIKMPRMDGLSFLKEIRKKGIKLNITVLSAHSDMSTVVEAMKLGASDFIAKPFQSEDEILLTLKKVEERDRLERENVRLRKEVEEKYTFSNIVAKSRKMTDIFKLISKIADYKTTVLIIGESGTGKELIAKAIHYNSNRKKQPLVSVNCGGIPETLLESELFGHVKGAFTDAYRGKKGLFEEADGGTLFLDEIGEMPLSLQVKLLRALQEEEIRPLGETKSVKVDVRIITATAKNLRKEVQEKRFREDLFYRVNVLAIELPPLRERREDIPILADHFIKKYNNRLNLKIEKGDHEYFQNLLDYFWPGNVRELENIIERSMALSSGNVLTVSNLPAELVDQTRGVPDGGAFHFDSYSIKKNSRNLEKYLIVKTLDQTGGNKTRAASLLEISVPTILYKMKEFGLGKSE